jgi:hypothetical protein
MSESANNAPTFNVGNNIRITQGTYRGSGQVLSVESTVMYTVATNIPVNGIMHLSPGEMELIPPPEEEPLSGNPNEDDVLNIDGDEFTYYGTIIGECYHCHNQVDAEEVRTERRNDNWMVPCCEGCYDPNNRPCRFCFQVECICQEMEDARSY